MLYGIPKYASNPCRVGQNSGLSPRCHFPMHCVAYPADFSTSAIVCSAGFSPQIDPGYSTCCGRFLLIVGSGARLPHPHPRRVAPRHQPRPRRRADRRHHVKVRELRPLRRHPVQPRRLDRRRPETTHVVVPLVVGEQDHDVRLPLRCLRRLRHPAAAPHRRQRQRRNRLRRTHAGSPCRRRPPRASRGQRLSAERTRLHSPVRDIPSHGPTQARSPQTQFNWRRTVCSAALLLAAAASLAPARETQSLDFDWRFALADPKDAASPAFDDAACARSTCPTTGASNSPTTPPSPAKAATSPAASPGTAAP